MKVGQVVRVTLLLGALPIIAAAQQTESNVRLAAQSKRCQKLLKESVLDFYLPLIDPQHGGYFQDLDEEGNFHGREGKFLVFQGRQLWLFSVLAHADIERERSLAAARTGFEFIREHFYDATRGGYYSKVQRSGKVVDERKHAYLNSFALYGFIAYYEASEDQRALNAANELFDTLETHAHDKVHGGYQEFFKPDWTPITDPNESRYVGAIDTKTYNTHLHLLEAFSELQRVAPRNIVRQRLWELVLINTSTVRHATHECNIDGWSRAWAMIDEPSNLRHSYGHDVECIWLVMRALDALGTPRSTLKGWAKSTADASMKFGYDRQHGGFFNSGPLGAEADDRRKVWWVQTEAMVSMLRCID